VTGLTASASAQAPQVITVHETAGYTGQLGVDAHGGAVVAWSESLTRRATYSVLARMRRPGGMFSAPQRLSSAEVEGPFALAVGARGDAAVVWRQHVPGRNARAVLVARARPSGRFGKPVTIASGPAAELAVAIDARGRLLVTMLRAVGRVGCGREVVASVSPPMGRLRPPRRVSAACPNAAMLSAALARDGRGAIAWRSGRSSESERTRFAVQVSTYARGRFSGPLTVSRGRVWYGRPALAAGGAHMLVAWRDRVRTTRAGLAQGRVRSATIDGGVVGAPVDISTSEAIEGDVYAAMNHMDAAIVSWTQRAAGDDGNRVAIRAARGARFAPAEEISPCASGAQPNGSGRDHLDSAAHAALDGSGRAVAVFSGSCGYGVGAARRPAGGPWQPPFGLQTQAETGAFRILSVGVSDAGEAVTAWWKQGPDAAGFDDAQLNVAVLPTP